MAALARSRLLAPAGGADAHGVFPRALEQREQIGAGPAAAALLGSAVLRTCWFPLVLMMPRTRAGYVLFYVVFAVVGIVLLHWCLGWFGWTISFRAAAAARALPALVGALLASAAGLEVTASAVAVLLGCELLVGFAVVSFAAERLETWIPPASEPAGVLDIGAVADLGSNEGRYATSLGAVVRAARESRPPQRLVR